MPDRKIDATWTDTLKGKPALYFSILLAVGVLVPFRAQSQSASEIYKRMSDMYAYAKSYQGTVVRIQKGETSDGKSASQTVTIKIAFKAPNKYFVNTMTSVNVSGKAQSFDQTMVCNGKASFTFSTSRKLYQREQIPNENMLSHFFALLTLENGFEVLPDSKLDGRPVFVLKPRLPLKGSATDLANAKKIKINMLIDKQSYQLLKITMESPTGNLVQTVSGQTVNGIVPESMFAWTPPANYKEFKSPAGPIIGPKVPH